MATAVKLCEPFESDVVASKKVYGEVVSAEPTFVPSTCNCTFATATLSDAEAVTVTVPETVEPAVGDVIETVGGVVSAVTVKVALLLVALPAELLTTTTKVEPLSALVVTGVVYVEAVPLLTAVPFFCH